MSERLRFFDPQLKEKPEQELFQEPDWLLQLKNLSNHIKVRNGVRVCASVYMHMCVNRVFYVVNNVISFATLSPCHS